MTRATFGPDDGRLHFFLHEIELDGLRHLLTDLLGRVESADSNDPAVVRLTPGAVIGDADADEELRAMIRGALLDERAEAARLVLSLLDRAESRGRRRIVPLVDDEPWTLLGCLNDIRLAIGARVGIEGLDRDNVTDPDTLEALAAIDHLGWWQWQLVAVLDPAAAAEEDGTGDA